MPGRRRPTWTRDDDAALACAVRDGRRTRAALDGAVRDRSGDAAYQRARVLGMVCSPTAARVAEAAMRWPAPEERRALAEALRRMAADGADLTDHGWVVVRMARETGVPADTVAAWLCGERGRD